PLEVMQPGSFRIVDGVVHLDNGEGGLVEKLTNVNATLDWPTTATAASLLGNAVWRGEVFKFDLSAASPLQMLAGSASKTNIKVDSAALGFSFVGDANMLAGFHLTGPAKFSTPSVNRLVALAGAIEGTGSNLGAFSAEGVLNATPTQIQMSDAAIAIDNNRCKGIFQIARNDNNRLQASATLAFSDLDLTPYLGIAEQQERAGDNALSVSGLLAVFDADLRISAERALLGSFEARDLAGALSVRNSELAFDVGNSTVMGGSLTGKIMLAASQGKTILTTEGALNGVSMPDVSRYLAIPGFSFTGKANAKFQSSSTGSGLQELRDNIKATLDLSGQDGSVEGIDFSAMRKVLAAKSATAGEPVLSGKSAYSRMSGRIAISGRTAWFRELTFKGSDTLAGIYGRAELGSGGLAIRARLSPVEGASDRDAYALAFIGGTIKAPLVMRDPAISRNGQKQDQDRTGT
ncbi:MAG: hypothetical protein KDJ51_04560, partial [Nitratireductor sp.]|nr:hypothetical protein [Nitratireductor sp.]